MGQIRIGSRLFNTDRVHRVQQQDGAPEAVVYFKDAHDPEPITYQANDLTPWKGHDFVCVGLHAFRAEDLDWVDLEANPPSFRSRGGRALATRL